MLLLKSFKTLKASSLVESVIAISIISISTLVAFMIYLNVVNQNKSISYYNAKHHIETLTQDIIKEHNYDDDIFIEQGYTIEKKVTINKVEHSAHIVFLIKTVGKTVIVNKLVSYYEI